MNNENGMRLKNRIKIAFCLVVLIPLVLTGLIFVLFLQHSEPVYPVPRLSDDVWFTAIVVFVGILILTSVIVAAWIYQQIASPLSELKWAARNIRDGNLDFTIDPMSNIREVNELSEDFEEMRIRLKESAEEKVEGDRESKELISNISHDLRTPITAIKGYALGLIEGVAATPEKQEHYIHTIYNKANDMDKLIDELTIYSRLDTNRIPYTFARLNVSDYFGDCIEDLRVDLQAQDIGLVYQNDVADDVTMIADAEQLKRAVNNVVSNAVKYMDKQPAMLHVRLRDVGDFIQVEFEDNGKGIAQRDLVRIFDRFYRTDASRNSRVGGSVIGLSIVKKILEDHEGKVWATSKEGVGTTIYFVLRKYAPTEADEPESE